MPAEWEPHQACLILFPHSAETFRLEKAQSQVLGVAKAIAIQGNETVYLLVKDEEKKKQVESLLAQETEDVSNIKVHICPSDDTWVRDTGPTCVIQDNQTMLGLDWDFNAYGGPDEGCYWPCELDRKVAKTVCSTIFDMPTHPVSLVLEGGSIHTDGEGTLMVTEECLLNPNRNPHLTKESIEQVLKKTLGVEVVIWLPEGLYADEDTNGHVDNFCCFSEPGHVVLAWTDDETNNPDNYKRCRKAEEILIQTPDAQGRILQVHHLVLPPPLKYTAEEVTSLSSGGDFVERTADEPMAASYVNFYIANKSVVVPQFGVQPADQDAVDVLAKLFPTRTVVGVPSREVLIGGGNIHCITQQIPPGPTSSS
eukprot:Nitzschia sp. Nitz4//scaffold15_size197535//19916//21016//NITZ4_001553-RA/size197535-processed-gene-0.4-mRNA-1//1//CDS//3329537640//1982//frame0